MFSMTYLLVSLALLLSENNTALQVRLLEDMAKFLVSS